MIIMVTKIKLLIVFACIAFTSGEGEEANGPPQPAPQPVLPNSTSTTEVPTTTSSSTTTNATTTTPSTTTPTPTTPSTTTPAPTTTPTPTTKGPITSTATTSTTTAEPTTPAPVPMPDIGKWNVTDHHVNKTYILAEMAVQLNITYDTVDNKTRYAVLDIPKNASAGGEFGNDTQSLDIMWFNKDTTSNKFSMLFEKNSTIKHFMIRNISVSLTATKNVFPDIRSNDTVVLYNNKTEFSTPLHKSYRCAKEQTFDLMKDGSNKTFGAVTLSHVQLEAFHEKMDVLFDAAEDCERSSSPDIVPIAVGCALVGLVAIVLIAYLVGRRRSQARGYLSM